MSISWSREKLAEVVGGSIAESGEAISFTGVEFDSREIRGGELFLAFKGENTHGHEYVQTALDRGAALCLVEDKKFLEHEEHAGRFVVVDDSLKAFWKLAHHYRKELNIPIIAITGSAGKTTVKEMAAQLLLTQEVGAYSRKSFNNHVGVPYTLCSIGKQHKWAVLEVGMSNPGEISNLTKIIEPDIALVTGVAPVHFAQFESVEAIAVEKCGIFDALSKDGTAIINQDNDLLVSSYKEATGEKFKLKTFGSKDGSDSKIKKATPLGLEGIECQIELAGEVLDIKIPVPGEHNAINAAAALLAAKALYPEADSQDFVKALSRFVPPVMRLNLVHLRQNRILVDDSYNANPLSMDALLKLAKQEKSQGRKVGLILGDMKELGSKAEECHAELAKNAASLKPEFFIAVGEYADLMSEVVKAEGVKAFSAQSPEAAGHTALKLPFDVLMIKASRGVELDRTVSLIRDREGVN